MKLLLTSAGINNISIAQSLRNLTGKDEKSTKIGFIPTAANVEFVTDNWFSKQIIDLDRFGFSWIDPIDISAVDVDWRALLSKVDVIFVSGGNTFHLLKWIRQSGFDKWFKDNLDNKVYVGASAASIIVSPTIGTATIEPADENIHNITNLTGMNLVDFEISPHTPDFVSYEACEFYSRTINRPLYAIDNQSAIQVIDNKVKIISEGNWELFD